MTLTIELNPEEEAWLAAEAAQSGVHPNDIVRRLIDSHLVTDISQGLGAAGCGEVDKKNADAIALLQSWIEEDRTDDPEAIQRAEDELDELKRNLNANRAATGERLVFP